jgi:hypothetical protein
MSFGEVRAALALGDPAFALAALRASLDAVDGGRAERAEWLALLARAGGMLGGRSFADAARGALADPDDPAALAALGARLLAERLPGMAVALLARAHRLAPSDAILAPLVAALAADGQHARAAAALRDAPGAASLGRRGAHACHALLAGHLDAARAVLPELVRGPEPTHAALAAVIGGMLARADAIAAVAPLDGGDLRGWHFVVTGGFLLRRAAHGLAAGMNGRYAYVHDAYGDCLAGIHRAARVLAALGQPVERVLLLDDRASAILGRAAAQVIGCPAVAWSPGERGLAVAYELAELASWDALREHRPGQVVLGHAASWTEEPPFAAELVTRLHQVSRAPWDRHTSLDPVTGARRELPADPADDATLAARIATASVAEDDADLAALLAIAEASRAVTGDAAALRSTGTRRRAWCGSPVQSLRF